MEKYGLGDIVKTKKTFGMNLYIILRIEKGLNEPVYHLANIYPITKQSMRVNFLHSDIEHGVSYLSENHGHIFDLIKFKYNEMYNGIPDYIDELDKNIIKDKKKPKRRRKKLKQEKDVVYYNKLESIDECLDALNDLDSLHKNFGGDAYLQLKEVVIKRLKELC